MAETTRIVDISDLRNDYDLMTDEELDQEIKRAEEQIISFKDQASDREDREWELIALQMHRGMCLLFKKLILIAKTEGKEGF